MSKKNKNINQVNNDLSNATGVSSYINNPANSFAPMFYNANPYVLSLQYIPIANMYKSNSFVTTAVDLPVEDAFRDGGFELDSDILDTDDLNKLKEKMSDCDDVERLKECVKWGRLYGGGVILVNTNQKSDTPFNPETIYGKEVEFLSTDRWQCYPMAKSLMLAEEFMLQDNLRNDKDSTIIVNKSRVIYFTGKPQPYYLRNLLQGWGASILENIVPQLNQYLKANSVILELLDEAKIDILKIDGLNEVLASAGGDSAIRKRLEIASANKNYKSMLALSTEDDYQQKQVNFGTLDAILEKIFLLICSAVRIPYSKLFGKGANGLGTGADLDIENYNSMVDADIRQPATRILKKMIDIRCYQLFGKKIDDLTVKWKPLRVLSAKEQQELTTSKINSYIQLINAGVLTRRQVAEKLVNEQIIAMSEEELDKIEEETDLNEFEEKQEKKPVKNSADKNIWQKLTQVITNVFDKIKQKIINNEADEVEIMLDELLQEAGQDVSKTNNILEKSEE